MNTINYLFYIRLLGLFLVFGGGIFAQSNNNDCACKHSYLNEVDTLFYLSNGKIIALCGYQNPDTKPVNYAEFILSICKEDLIIDFWGAQVYCEVKTKQDTVVVDELKLFPTGFNFELKQELWTSEKIYFDGNDISRNISINPQLTKYNKNQIKLVLKSYRSLEGTMDESKMEIAHRLFIAILSGNHKAKKYFYEMETKFGELNGGFKKEYDDLKAMLSFN